MRHRKCDTTKHRKLSKKQRRNRRENIRAQQLLVTKEEKVTPPIDVSDIETVWSQRKPVSETEQEQMSAAQRAFQKED